MPDPRKPRGVGHELCDIVTIGIPAVICGADTRSQIHPCALAQEGVPDKTNKTTVTSDFLEVVGPAGAVVTIGTSSNPANADFAGALPSVTPPQRKLERNAYTVPLWK